MVGGEGGEADGEGDSGAAEEGEEGAVVGEFGVLAEEADGGAIFGAGEEEVGGAAEVEPGGLGGFFWIGGGGVRGKRSKAERRRCSSGQTAARSEELEGFIGVEMPEGLEEEVAVVGSAAEDEGGFAGGGESAVAAGGCLQR